MKKVQIELRVSSTREAEQFYCNDLGMFDFYQDYGMGNICLVYKANTSFLLLLVEGVTNTNNIPLFSLEVDDCELVFQKLKKALINSKGALLNDNVFEYPPGKNITLEDPAKNTFLLFQEHR